MNDDLSALLAESVTSAAARADQAFAERGGSVLRPIVLFGAGNLGQRLATVARGLGYDVVAFADNGKARWGTTLLGLPVLSPVDAATRYGGDAVFLVSIWGAGQGHRYADTERQLRALGVRRVAAFGHFAWQHPAPLLPYYALGRPEIPLRAATAIDSVYGRLADETSRAEFLAQLRWRLHLDYAGLRTPEPPESEYFDRSIVTGPVRTFVDGGAYDGDTLSRFIDWTGGDFDAAIGIEADAANVAKLNANVSSMTATVAARVRVASVALAGKSGFVHFDALGTAASAVSQSGTRVEAMRLAEVVGDLRPDYVKLDIEGAEVDVLTDSREALARWNCAVAACSYHLPDHLWKVPALLAEALPHARLSMRSYGSECYDLVTYAVP